MTEHLEESLDVGIANIIDSFLMDLHTCTIGEVTAFDRVAQTVSVQPVIKRKAKGVDETIIPAVITDVPVVWPGAGNWWIVQDIPAGAYVLLVFAERAIATWQDQGGIVDPQRARKFDLSDAIAIPGINPDPGKINPAVVADTLSIRNRDNTTKIELTASNITLTNGGGTIVLNSSGQMNVNSGNLTVDK